MRIGLVGRGLVAEVLFQRMEEENNFYQTHQWSFFSTSQHGKKDRFGKIIKDAMDVNALRDCDIIVTCQGSAWTNEMYPKLKNTDWEGRLIDSSSALRMQEDSIIVLDPVNNDLIEYGLVDGIKVFCGGNCTVSLMLMACQGLIREGLVEWINADTYQAASGAGAENMRELIAQMKHLSSGIELSDQEVAVNALKIDTQINQLMTSGLPINNFGAPLAGSLIPWIDSVMENGQTREEWKGYFEGNKILGATKEDIIPIDGLCVRVGVMRCHSQSITMKLKKLLSLAEIEKIIKGGNEWIDFIPNTKQETLKHLSPAAVSGTLRIAVGRLHKATFGKGRIIKFFTVGDQLLWGAAEPIRRALNILIENL